MHRSRRNGRPRWATEPKPHDTAPCPGRSAAHSAALQTRDHPRTCSDYWVPRLRVAWESCVSFDLQTSPLTAALQKFRHGGDEPLDVLRARKAMIAVFHQREHDVVLREARGQLDGMLPGNVGILYALENAHRTAGLDHAAEQKMAPSILDEV